MRLQRLPACRPSPKLSATVVAPSSVTLRDYNKMIRRTRLSTATSTCFLVGHPTTSGNVARADPERDGSIRSGRTTVSLQPTSGGVQRVMVTDVTPRSNATAPAGYAITTTTNAFTVVRSTASKHAVILNNCKI